MRRVYHETVAERIAAELRDRIVRWEHQPGERLRQAELAEEFGVSQASVRDALRQLEVDGLVISHPRRGVAVSDLSENEINDLLDMLISLEAIALRASVPHLPSATIERLRRLWDSPIGSDDPIAIGRRQLMFSEGLYTASARWRLVSEIRRLRLFTLRYLGAYLSKSSQPVAQDTSVLAILDACEKGDIEAAVKYMTEMYEKEREAIIGALARSAQRAAD